MTSIFLTAQEVDQERLEVVACFELLCKRVVACSQSEKRAGSLAVVEGIDLGVEGRNLEAGKLLVEKRVDILVVGVDKRLEVGVDILGRAAGRIVELDSFVFLRCSLLLKQSSGI